MVAGAKLVESWADFFDWNFSHFWFVSERVSIVCVFLLSSPRCDCVVPGGAGISFWTNLVTRLRCTKVGPIDMNIWKFDGENEISSKNCGEPNDLRNWICEWFDTSISTRALRCAQCSGFWRRHVYVSWVVCVGLVHGTLELNYRFWQVIGRLPHEHWSNIACTDCFFKPSL